MRRIFIFLVCLLLAGVPDVSGQCDVTIGELEFYCSSSTTYSLTFDIYVFEPNSDYVQVVLNSSEVYEYNLSDFPISIENIDQSVNPMESLTVCVGNDSTCCQTLGFQSPTFYCSDCFNYFLEYTYTCNEVDSTYIFDFIPIHTYPELMAPSGNLYIDIDGNSYEMSYNQGEMFSIDGVQLNPLSIFHEVLVFFTDVDCGISFIFLASPTCSDLCVVESIEVSDLVCQSDTSYNMTVNPVFIVPDELVDLLSCNVTINGVDQGFFSLSDVPIQFDDISISNETASVVQVCVFGADGDCCNYTEYTEPDCFVESVDEMEASFKLYPNPASDYVQIEGVQGELFVFNYLGTMVAHEDYVPNELDISSFEDGVYFLVIAGNRTYRRRLLKGMN